ncbi:hypothetical protein D5085_12405 [Ectothiorhodospiraceae bacterium BW-2]|nr:hypothetical protein D5085_12405 [Ectothiorhodospiraceae bacterium BW-2]
MMMKQFSCTHFGSSGFTLVEIMIGMFVGLFVIGGTISYYSASTGNSADIVRMARLHQDLGAISHIIAGEVRRAGYWGGGPGLDNPFMQPPYLLAISVNSGATCLSYSYDYNGANPNGTLDTTGDVFGMFRYDVTNRAIEMYKRVNSAGTGANFTCTNSAASDWEDITDPTVIEVTAFSADFVGSRCANTETGGGNWQSVTVGDTTLPCDTNSVARSVGDKMVESRYVNFSITARLVSDNSVTLTLSESVAVANNRTFYATAAVP